MKTPAEKDVVPTLMVRLMTGIVLLCLVLTAAHVWTGQPKEAVLPPSPVIAQKTLVITGDMSGAATVWDADGGLIADLSPEEGGFISGVRRVLDRERTKSRVALDAPVVLTAHENGRMMLTDPETGWRADLMGFGQDNAAAFAKLLITDPQTTSAGN
jgi:putative photosynthetic complex assembly protein